jgi:hypothetical protein
MNTLILVIAFFSFAVLRSDETVTLMSRQAEALVAAQEISSASALYAEMLKRSLPPWQRARVL